MRFLPYPWGLPTTVMVQKPRRTVCRTRLGKRMHVRIPPSSHSLRQVVLAVSQDPQIPLPTIRRLNERILETNTDEEHWAALITTVERAHVLRALEAVCSRAQTGPVTALVIHNLMADANYRERERAEAQRDAADMELKRQRSGQAFLASCEWFL